MSVLSELSELEDKPPNPWLRRLRNLALAIRIGGMIYQPLPGPALPVQPPPIVEVDQRQRRRGDAGGSGELYDQMRRLGRLAATCRSEAEAEAYAGALPTLAAQLAPGAAAPLLGSAARLSRGLSDATRFLRAHPATRGMVRVLPAATRNAALRLEREALSGRPVTSDICARTLAEETVRAVRHATVR